MRNQSQFIIKDEGQRDKCIYHLASLDLSKPWRVTVEEYHRNRSLAQNSLYWMWMTIIRDHVAATTGEEYRPDDVHEWFKDEFLPPRVIALGGRTKLARKTTTLLTVTEFSEYLERIEYWCNERLDLILPTPADLYQEAMSSGEINPSRSSV